jgi:glycosyltransferase involved in cell wall biosynthesis
LTTKSESKRKKILVLTSTFPRWKDDSEPTFIYELCLRMSSDFDIFVLAPHAPFSKTMEIMDSINVVRFKYFFDWGESLAYEGGILAKLRDNRLRYMLIPFFMVCQWIALVRLVLTQKIDVVHAHWLFPQGLVAGAAKQVVPTFPRLVCTSHGTDLNGLKGILFEKIKRFVIRQSDTLTVVSNDMKLTARSLGADARKTLVISMGVDAAEAFAPSTTTIRCNNELLFVGRLVTQKGVDQIIGAMPEVLSKYPDCKLRIVGQGPDCQRLKALGYSLGLGQHVEFVGSVPNSVLPDYFRKATVLVFPSVEAEGFGLVCVEAMACECPVIASDLTALQEVVEHGVTGLTFQSGNCEDLAQQVLLLLSDKPLRSRLGNAGRSFVAANFDWERQAARYIEVLNRVDQHT